MMIVTRNPGYLNQHKHPQSPDPDHGDGTYLDTLLQCVSLDSAFRTLVILKLEDPGVINR